MTKRKYKKYLTFDAGLIEATKIEEEVKEYQTLLNELKVILVFRLKEKKKRIYIGCSTDIIVKPKKNYLIAKGNRFPFEKIKLNAWSLYKSNLDISDVNKLIYKLK